MIIPLTFNTNGFIIKDNHGKILGRGHKAGLYALVEQKQELLQAYTTFSTSNKAAYTIWHKRMEHMNDKSLNIFVILT